MASMYPPEFNVIDAGDAPVFFIDGVAVHDVSGGVVRISLYTDQPILEPGTTPGEPCRHMKVVVVKLVYTLATQVTMRRQLVAHLGDSMRPSDLVALS